MRLFFARSVSEMVNTAHLPSVETSGAPRRCIMCMSVAVIGRARAGEAASTAAVAARRSEVRVMPQAYNSLPRGGRGAIEQILEGGGGPPPRCARFVGPHHQPRWSP